MLGLALFSGLVYWLASCKIGYTLESALGSGLFIGFLYGMYSSNHDIECIFIDGILKHADISIENIPGFIDRLKKLSEECGINFYVSISAEKAELKNINLDGCTLLN